MRIRYEIYKNGLGTGTVAMCDLTEKKANDLYESCYNNSVCGWAELVGEDDDNYMDVLKSFDHIKSAVFMSNLLGGLK